MSHSMDSNLNFRMSSHDKYLIETAARLKGLKPNTYARQKLLEIAERDIAEMGQVSMLTLDEAEWGQFIAIMEEPPELNSYLRRAVETFNKHTSKKK